MALPWIPAVGLPLSLRLPGATPLRVATSTVLSNQLTTTAKVCSHVIGGQMGMEVSMR